MSSSSALRAARGEIRPVISTFDCRMIQVLPTSREPMRSFVDRIKALHGKDGMLSVSVIHGFMAADVPEMGTRILVVTDDDKAKGDALAERLGRELFALREQDGDADAGHRRRHRPGAGRARRATRQAGGHRRHLGQSRRRRRRRRHARSCAGCSSAASTMFGVATIWDPIAVTFCLAAGEGAVIELRFGGKAGPQAGEPIDARVEVLKAVAEGWQSFGPSRVTLGPTALVRIEGTEIDIILNTNRTQTFEPDIFSNLGVDPLGKDMLLVKSTNHFYAGFAPIAAEIIYVDGAELLSEQSGGDRLQEADAAGLAAGGGSLEGVGSPLPQGRRRAGSTPARASPSSLRATASCRGRPCRALPGPSSRRRRRCSCAAARPAPG